MDVTLDKPTNLTMIDLKSVLYHSISERRCKMNQQMKAAIAVLGKYSYWQTSLKKLVPSKPMEIDLPWERCDESFCSDGPHGCHCK